MEQLFLLGTFVDLYQLSFRGGLMCFCILTMNQTESPLIPILIPAVSIVKCNEHQLFLHLLMVVFYPFHEHVILILAFLSFKKVIHPTRWAQNHQL